MAARKLSHCKYGHELTPGNTRSNSQGGRMCVTCARRRGRTHYYARVRGNPDALAKAHAVQRRWKYGLVDSKYQSMVAQAKGRCSVCLNDFNTTNRKMVIDHDHESGIVRGLLCSKCNVALGMLGDSKETVVRLLSHLS